MRRGFTLVELMVVVGIVVILAAIAVPSIGPMLTANHQAEVTNTLGSLLTIIQTRSQSDGSPVAIRIERAFETNERGLMLDANGQTFWEAGAAFTGPVWLDHQRVRILSKPFSQDPAFHQKADTIYNLPNGFWIAPGYCLNRDPKWQNHPNYFPSLAENDLIYNPVNAAAYNVIENFYIVFDGQGELIEYDQSGLVYADKTQINQVSGDPETPRVIHPNNSARSLLIYDRKRWNNILQTDDAARYQLLVYEAKPIYMNRALGTIVEGTQQ